MTIDALANMCNLEVPSHIRCVVSGLGFIILKALKRGGYKAVISPVGQSATGSFFDEMGSLETSFTGSRKRLQKCFFFLNV